MKKIYQLPLFAAALLFLPFLQSCNDDDDNSGGGPTAITYPHTISFSHFENVEFKMWTNGAEVNTTGLDFLDFVEDDEDSLYLSSGYYETTSGFTFTEDSLFSTTPDGFVEMYPYFISNDSVFIVIPVTSPVDTTFNFLLGVGSLSYLRKVQGFTQYCDLTDGELSMIFCTSNLQQEFQSLESAMDEYGISSLEEIEEGDTLIINNRYVHFQ